MNYGVNSSMLFAKMMPIARNYFCTIMHTKKSLWNFMSVALQLKYHSTLITYVLTISGKVASKTLRELIMVMNRHIGSTFPSTSWIIDGVWLAVHYSYAIFMKGSL